LPLALTEKSTVDGEEDAGDMQESSVGDTTNAGTLAAPKLQYNELFEENESNSLPTTLIIEPPLIATREGYTASIIGTATNSKATLSDRLLKSMLEATANETTPA
jgi:hypothetical protein